MEVFQSSPNGRRPQGRSRTCCIDYSSSGSGILREKPGNTADERAFWAASLWIDVIRHLHADNQTNCGAFCERILYLCL